jgi:SAM-dependent methyltransferase
MSVDPAIDRRRLREQAYPDSGNLLARSSIYVWQQPRRDFHGLVLGQVEWAAGQRVLDVGCGPGAYLRRLHDLEPGLRLAGLDLSPGMASEARANVPAAGVMVADAQSLPFPDGQFDHALAPHMLYHVPDIAGAVRELRRVLRPGGVLLVVTNALDHLDGFKRVLAAAAGVPHWMRAFERFGLENAPGYLEAEFESVTLVRSDGELVVPEVEPVVRYVESTRSSLEPKLPAGMDWNDAITRVRAEVAREIDETGAFRSATRAGVLVCR